MEASQIIPEEDQRLAKVIPLRRAIGYLTTVQSLPDNAFIQGHHFGTPEVHELPHVDPDYLPDIVA